MPDHYGGVAQLGEHLPCKQGVMSSNLTISIRCESIERKLNKEAFGLIAQPVRAHA